MIANSAVAVGKVFGIERGETAIDHIMAAIEPRVKKGIGVTSSKIPIGADHTVSLTLRVKVGHPSLKISIEVLRNSSIKAASYDNLGACVFSGFSFAMDQQTICDMLEERYDWQVGDEILKTIRR